MNMADKSGVSLNWGGFDRAIANAGKKLANTRPLMASIGEALVSGTIKRFVAEEAPDGQKWAKSERAANDDGTTLTDTGRLRKSIDYAATPSTVMVGSNLIYARIHQLGGQTGRNHKTAMPARPYLGVSKADMEETRATLKAFLTGCFK